MVVAEEALAIRMADPTSFIEGRVFLSLFHKQGRFFLSTPGALWFAMFL